MKWFLPIIALIVSYSAPAADLTEQSRLSPTESTQDAAEATKESTGPVQGSANSIINKVIMVVPPYFHGSALETISGTASEAPAKLANFAKAEDINIGQIVRSEFDQQLSLSPDLSNHLRKDVSIRYNLAVRYGITRTSFSPHKPYLSVAIAAIDSSGKAVWKESEYTGAFGSLPSIDYDDFFKSPDKFRSTYEDTAKAVIQSLLKKIAQTSGLR